MVILGAGASYDSELPDAPIAGSEAIRPPLARELVDWRFAPFATRYPASRPVVARLRAVLDADPASALETELAELIAESGASPDIARQLMAFRFYLRDIIGETTREWMTRLNGFTQYVTLLDRLGAWQRHTLEPVTLVTFNYDRMLEMAAEDQVVGWRFTGFDSYTERDDWRLLKLHGSVDWARVVPSMRFRLKRNYDSAVDVAPDLDVSSLDWQFRRGWEGDFTVSS
jgi:hypothetical protein